MHGLRTGRGVIGGAHQAGAYSLGLGLERYLNRATLPNFPALATIVSLQEISGYGDGKLERPFPELVNVIFLGAVVFPTSSVPKLRDVGNSLGVGTLNYKEATALPV
jgi:hypothetical protein